MQVTQLVNMLLFCLSRNNSAGIVFSCGADKCVPISCEKFLTVISVAILRAIKLLLLPTTNYLHSFIFCSLIKFQKEVRVQEMLKIREYFTTTGLYTLSK